MCRVCWEPSGTHSWRNYTTALFTPGEASEVSLDLTGYQIIIYRYTNYTPTVFSELRTHSRGLIVFILFKQKLSSLYLFVILEAREHLGKYFELHFIQTVIISVIISFFSTKLIILGRASSYLKHIQCTVSHKPGNECVYSWKRLSDRITIMNTCAAVSQQITNC